MLMSMSTREFRASRSSENDHRPFSAQQLLCHVHNWSTRRHWPTTIYHRRVNQREQLDLLDSLSSERCPEDRHTHSLVLSWLAEGSRLHNHWLWKEWIRCHQQCWFPDQCSVPDECSWWSVRDEWSSGDVGWTPKLIWAKEGSSSFQSEGFHSDPYSKSFMIRPRTIDHQTPKRSTNPLRRLIYLFLCAVDRRDRRTMRDDFLDERSNSSTASSKKIIDVRPRSLNRSVYWWFVCFSDDAVCRVGEVSVDVPDRSLCQLHRRGIHRWSQHASRCTPQSHRDNHDQDSNRTRRSVEIKDSRNERTNIGILMIIHGEFRRDVIDRIRIELCAVWKEILLPIGYEEKFETDLNGFDHRGGEMSPRTPRNLDACVHWSDRDDRVGVHCHRFEVSSPFYFSTIEGLSDAAYCAVAKNSEERTALIDVWKSSWMLPLCDHRVDRQTSLNRFVRVDRQQRTPAVRRTAMLEWLEHSSRLSMNWEDFLEKTNKDIRQIPLAISLFKPRQPPERLSLYPGWTHRQWSRYTTDGDEDGGTCSSKTREKIECLDWKTSDEDEEGKYQSLPVDDAEYCCWGRR